MSCFWNYLHRFIDNKCFVFLHVFLSWNQHWIIGRICQNLKEIYRILLQILLWLPMMTSSNGNISAFLVLCEVNPPIIGGLLKPVTRNFDIFFDLVWTNGWANKRDTGDLRRHRTHYDFTIVRWLLAVWKRSISVQKSFIQCTSTSANSPNQ